MSRENKTAHTDSDANQPPVPKPPAPKPSVPLEKLVDAESASADREGGANSPGAGENSPNTGKDLQSSAAKAPQPHPDSLPVDDPVDESIAELTQNAQRQRDQGRS